MSFASPQALFGFRRLKYLLATPVTDGPHSTPEFFRDGIPFLSVDGIQEGELVFEGCRYITEEDFAEFSKKSRPQRDDILLGKAASTGKTARVKSDAVFGIWSPLALIRADARKVDSSFLEHCLKSTLLQFQIEGLCNANTQKNIGMADIPLLSIPLPPVETQQAIAAYLDRETAKIDLLIAKKRELIEKLKEQRSALISRTVTRGLPPAAAKAAGLNPNPLMKDSGVAWLGEVPEHWKISPLGYLVKILGGGTPDKGNPEFWFGDIPWVSAKDMKVSRISDAEDHISEEAVHGSAASIIPINSLLIVVRGMILLHTFPLALTERELTINQDMKALICKGDLSPEYLFWALSGLAPVLVATADEAAHGTKKIDTGVLKRFQVMVPPSDEQAVIVQFLNATNARYESAKSLAESAIARLIEYRAALITAAVTGQIEVAA